MVADHDYTCGEHSITIGLYTCIPETNVILCIIYTQIKTKKGGKEQIKKYKICIFKLPYEETL